MECRFEGSFTDEEKRCIRSSLCMLEVTTDMLGIDIGADWHVERTGNKTWAQLIARHTQSDAEFRARSVCELDREFRKAATFLERPQNG